MPLLMLIGLGLGPLLAVGVHQLCGWLRRVQPAPLAVVGWVIVGLWIVGMWFVSDKEKDPYGWTLFVYFYGGLLVLAIVAFLAKVRLDRDGVEYLVAFGHVLAEFVGAILLALTIAPLLPPGMAEFTFQALLISLLVLEVYGPVPLSDVAR